MAEFHSLFDEPPFLDSKVLAKPTELPEEEEVIIKKMEVVKGPLFEEIMRILPSVGNRRYRKEYAEKEAEDEEQLLYKTAQESGREPETLLFLAGEMIKGWRNLSLGQAITMVAERRK